MQTKHRASGFTLVEIMIVVAIIALLAAIAVPSFLRARQRAYASNAVEAARLLTAAADQYLIENRTVVPTTAPTANMLSPYVKEGSDAYRASQTALTTPYAISSGLTVSMATLGAGAKVNADTANFDTAVVPNANEFFGPAKGTGWGS